jgi:hypothetical protein
MNIRKWFGVEISYDNNKFNVSLDALLQLYKECLVRYFNLENIKDSNELLAILKTTELGIGDSMFLEWYEQKGLPNIKKVALWTDHSDEQMIAEIDYEHYILSEEMNAFDYPEEVRSVLISVSSYLFDKIIKAA